MWFGKDSYVGQIAVGRLNNGKLSMNKSYSLCTSENHKPNQKFSALYTFQGLDKIQVDEVEAGDIIAFAGIKGISIGDTISDNESPEPLPRIKVDEPTVSMLFYVNDSPFAGKEGKFLTTRHLSERLDKEILRNVSLQVMPTKKNNVFEVRGRGELQMAILIETMRREGYEFMVSKPQVITKEENGKTLEPMEKVFLDVPEDKVGILTKKLSARKGRMTNLQNHGTGRVNLEFSIPSRGLIGFRSQFMTDTNGAGIMNKLFDGHASWFGPIPQRNSGAYNKIITKTINNFKNKGSKINNLIAVIGPCIAKQSYEVQSDFLKRFLNQNKFNKNFFNFKNKKIFFSLNEYIKNQLKNSGVGNMEIINKDTFLNKNNFFSSRRSLKNNFDDCGRNISIIMIK